MKHTLVIVADLGCLKTYRLDTTPRHTSHLELLDQVDNPGATAHLTDLTSDASGRFPGRAARQAVGMSDGERHNTALERKRRRVREMAASLNQLLEPGSISGCYLAASREIHNPLMEALKPEARAMIIRTVSADLTKLDESGVLSHF
jgi:hypothetical protein